MFYLGEISSFTSNLPYEYSINGVSVLLIKQKDAFYLIENKCGHFGVPLIDAEIQHEKIICSNHGISFSLLTGHVINRPHENCDMLRVFTTIRKDTGLYVKDPIT